MQNEVKLLLELLPKYLAHVEKHPHTLLVKFFGLYRVVPESGSKVSHACAGSPATSLGCAGLPVFSLQCASGRDASIVVPFR